MSPSKNYGNAVIKSLIFLITEQIILYWREKYGTPQEVHIPIIWQWDFSQNPAIGEAGRSITQ